MSDKKVRKVHETPVLIKVTVAGGQAKVSLPKEMALKMNLIDENGGQGIVRHLLVKYDQERIILFPVEMPEVDVK